MRTRFYEVEHDLSKGGAISSVVFPNGSGENLLIATMASEVVLSEGETYGDLYETTPKCRVERKGANVSVTMEGRLCLKPSADNNAQIKPSEVRLRYRTTYLYRWGHIRVRRQFLFPDEGVPVSQLLVHEWKLRPDIGHYGIRPGTPAKDVTDCGECQWGRLRPGGAFDYPYRSCYVPRHVVCGNPGREGIEWFTSSDLAQWTCDVGGEAGHGEVLIAAQAQPPAAILRISALLMPRRDLRHREVSLKGTLAFDFVLGLPLISGQAQKPFLHRSFNRKSWPTGETISAWAKGGVCTAHFHHDGDTFHDGLFWRDGVYPPFGPEDMAEFDRVVDDCHRHRIRVTTYFSNKELHPISEAFKKHGREWARLPDGHTLVHNLYSGDEYGGQMCLRSGWLDFFKQYVDTVLSHHKLDGIYYDWNQAIYCNNAMHSQREDVDAPGRDALIPAAQKDSSTSHWDMDELIELMEWTRQRVGPDGMVIIHNTMNPCAVIENFADYVVAMEWGCGQLSLQMPSLEDLPLEWNFFGSRSRALIVNGCLDINAPEPLRRQMVLSCLLTGVAPWPASDLALEMFAPLSRENLSGFRFLDWRCGVAVSDQVSVVSAAYVRSDRVLIILVNLTGQPVKTKVKLDHGVLELAPSEYYRVTDLADEKAVQLGANHLFEGGWAVSIAGDSCKIISIEQALTDKNSQGSRKSLCE